MGSYTPVRLSGDRLVSEGRPIEKTEAMRRIRQGLDVHADKKKAHSLALALSEGQGDWKDAPHVPGGYRHYHDASHQYRGHIFYGGPS
ncbi:hypothetical protein PV773_23590 [Mesorhizobium sp. CC13]|uniref:hypothetical protein n=1 Tax=Mesorhizobium sp. CC13 TaxID=3029194 RepID=UPI0032664C44